MKDLFEPVAMKLLTVLLQLVIIVVCMYGMTALNKVKKRLEAKIGKENYDTMMSFVKMLVVGVEQQYPQLAGEGKYNVVIQAFNKKFGNVLSDEEINQLVEAAVGEMNLIKKSGQQKALSAAEPQECEEVPPAEINPTGQITNTDSL